MAHDPVSISKALKALQAVPWLRVAQMQTLDLLAEAAHFEQHGPGTEIGRRGAACSHLMVVVSGFLLLGFDLADGRRHVVNMVGPGQVHALIPVLDEKPLIHDARTKGWVEMLLVPRDVMVKAMQQDTGLTWQVLRLLSQRSRYLYEALAERTALPLAVRLARILRGFFAQYGDTLDMSQETLAEILGVARQSVNVELQQLQFQGVLEIGRSRLRLTNRSKLMESAVHDGDGLPGPGSTVKDRSRNSADRHFGD